MRYLGLTLLVIASQRELSLGKVRPDALLQAFLFLAIAGLLGIWPPAGCAMPR